MRIQMSEMMDNMCEKKHFQEDHSALTADRKILRELRHDLHQHPELSCREEQTIRRLSTFLREHTELEVVEREGWLYACYHSDAAVKRSPIAFRAEIDALPIDETLDLPYASVCPGVSHKCGHDGHAAALAGFGCYLEKICPERDVYLIFEPGEEIGAGGEKCSTLIEEKKIGEIFACHNWSGFPKNTVIVRPGPIHCASEGITIFFHGTASHASMPEEGSSPVHAITQLIQWSQQEAGPQQIAPSKPLLLATVVGMEAGGRNFGMSPADGSVSFTLRAEREADLTQFIQNLLDQAGLLAQQDRLAFSFEECDIFPETVNDPLSTQKVLEAASRLGLEYQILENPIRASEDFGAFLKKCPGAIFYIGNGETYPEIHTKEFDFPDEHLETIRQLFAALCRM